MGYQIISHEKLWMEDEAVKQLEKFSQLDGVLEAMGLPDLHVGKVVVGATFQTKEIIYPFLIGNDIGCGMALFDTNLKLKKFDLTSFEKKLKNTFIDGDYSIGGGNHFAEFQRIEKIYSQEEAKVLNLEKKHLYLLVHSGSRGMGDKIYREFASINGLKVGQDAFVHYMHQHQQAIEFAKENRMHIADLLLEKVVNKFDNHLIVDCHHNYIKQHEGYYYHHKGSVSSLDNYAIIAGSRGTHSYLVKCIPTEATLYSISHGAGRKWPRHLCKGRLENKYTKETIQTTKLGSKVITNKKELLYEEASEAYKDIESVMEALKQAGCIEIVASFHPLLTYKC